MPVNRRGLLLALEAATLGVAPLVVSCRSAQKPEAELSIPLPAPKRAGTVSLEETLQNRRSIRQYQNEPLTLAQVGQLEIARGPATFVFSGVYERTAGRYKERTLRYVHMEAGHAAQNLCLQAVALGLGSVVMGAFDDERVKRVAGMPGEEAALYLVTVGKP